MFDFTGENFLVADDQPINIIVIQSLLEKCGATVDSAENGAVAYEKFIKSKAEEYRCIFMDLQMPEMNGYEAARAIRESIHPFAKKIKIIAMTADFCPEDAQKCAQAGINGHILKPISLDAIGKAINNK